MAIRAFARRHVPFAFRLRVRLARRALTDLRQRTRFAREPGDETPLPFTIASYERPFIDYPGQEALGVAKRKNQRILASFLHGTLIDPGEVFSIWRLAGRPLAGRGYEPAAALKNGELVSDTGGAICLLSTTLFNVALLAGMEIVERWCHSVDSYGPNRYFELGRDAAIEYGYRDLRFRNPSPFPVRLEIEVCDATVAAKLTASEPAPVRVSLSIEETATARERRVSTVRTLHFATHSRTEAPFLSIHRIP